METSPPPFPSSFDPAIHLHSEAPLPSDNNLPPIEHQQPPSESFSDDFEALNLQRLENTRNKVVIQHRAWNLSDVFRSDEDVRPDTPTRSYKPSQLKEGCFPSSPPTATAKMPFISSPVAFPSSAPSPDAQKRKNDEQSQSQATEPKKQKIMGGFLDDDDEDDDAMDAFRDAHFRSEFDMQEDLTGQSSVEQPDTQGQGPAPQPAHTEPAHLPEPTVPTAESSTFTSSIPSRRAPLSIPIKTCSGKTHNVRMKKAAVPVPYERLVASRSTTAPGRAQKSYYGIEIHKLLDEAAKEAEQSKAAKSLPRPTVQPSIEPHMANGKSKKYASAMWTEKYRARKFTELIGDERTHRSILRWLKGWDPIVYPNLARSKPKKTPFGNDEEERPHRKVLLLCGPPGLGKTTLAHVCARQAGYEALEINASDDRSRDVVKGRIRDALGTENVKGMNVDVDGQKVRKIGRPVCVVVDEVDGVVSGSGGSGEGGFMKALIDLVYLDQKNSTRSSEQNAGGRKRKGDNFRFLRPLILVCNDLYHASLRPLRQSSVAEIIHVRQAPLENVVTRMKTIFTKEGIPADNDGVRRLCEASWGLARRKQQGNVKNTGTAEGDIRTVLVAGEWVAHKLRSENALKLTRNWLEQRVLNDDAGGGSFKGLNRGGVRDIVDRVFMEGAGFPPPPVGSDSFEDPYDRNSRVPVGVADLRKRHGINKLREMVDASGDHDRCATECFASYPLHSFQDDTFLTKPNTAYDWLHFHDTVSSKVFGTQEWELSGYLSQSVVAFHHLFASSKGKRSLNPDEEEEEHPFFGPRAEFAAFEAQKQNSAIITGFQSSFSAPLTRLFRSTDSLVTDLIPNVVRMLSPDVKPVVVRGSGDQRSVASVRKESERALVQSAVRVMAGLGVTFERVRVEGEGGTHGGWAYRMEPPLDSLITFSKMNNNNNNNNTTQQSSASAPVRYAVRQVLDQEYRKETARKQTEAISAAKTGKKPGRQSADDAGGEDEPTKRKALRDAPGVKRDFFGRIVREPTPQPDESGRDPAQEEALKAGRKVWVTYHDGFSNAVRKPITMAELMGGL